MNKEDFFIKQFSNSKFIGDDGAVINQDVYSQDAFFENVHFKTSWMSLKQIAQKAMLVNISDAIVMNAVPKYALLTVAIPKSYTNKDLVKLASGFKKGDEIIVPAQTHTATAHAAEYTGAKVIFSDVEPLTGNITLKEIKKMAKPNFTLLHIDFGRLKSLIVFVRIMVSLQYIRVEYLSVKLSFN